MFNILIACTGSVATIKLPLLLKALAEDQALGDEVQVRIILTKHAQHFLMDQKLQQNVDVFLDEDEWASWSQRGDPVVHIELAKWANLMVIAPLDANTLAKIANGICDNLLTCTVRAWELTKPLVFCPAMNTKMYQHPITGKQIELLQSWGYHLVPVISKTLMCGDTGEGAMAEVGTIVEHLRNILCTTP